MFDDLITRRPPPQKRLPTCDGDMEHQFSESAVMLAFAMHPLRTFDGLKAVTNHPDGEHGKRFDIRAWLLKRGFDDGPYGQDRLWRHVLISIGQSVVVNPSPGRRDIAAEIGSVSIIAECKGGVINTRH
jgi:hypothetical protein